MSIGHGNPGSDNMYNAGKYNKEAEGNAIWVWRERENKLDYTFFDPKLHPDFRTFGHSGENCVRGLNGSGCSGRFDSKKKKCSVTCSVAEPPQELLWKLQEIFGEDITFVDFTQKT